MMGLAQLPLGTELKVEVDKLIKEGWSLSESAGKQLSKEQLEKFRGKCDALMDKVKVRNSGDEAPSSS